MEIDITKLQLSGAIESTGAPNLETLTALQMALCTVVHGIQVYKRQCNVYPDAAIQNEIYSVICQLALQDLRQLCKTGTLNFNRNINQEIMFSINTKSASDQQQ